MQRAWGRGNLARSRERKAVSVLDSVGTVQHIIEWLATSLASALWTPEHASPTRTNKMVATVENHWVSGSRVGEEAAGGRDLSPWRGDG